VTKFAMIATGGGVCSDADERSFAAPSLGPAAVTIRAPFAVRETGILRLCPRPPSPWPCGFT